MALCAVILGDKVKVPVGPGAMTAIIKNINQVIIYGNRYKPAPIYESIDKVYYWLPLSGELSPQVTEG